MQKDLELVIACILLRSTRCDLKRLDESHADRELTDGESRKFMIEVAGTGRVGACMGYQTGNSAARQGCTGSRDHLRVNLSFTLSTKVRCVHDEGLRTSG